MDIDVNKVAILVAGGKGLRMKNNVRKQYLQLAGTPVLARTLKVFNDCEIIDRIILVIPKDDVDVVKNNILACLTPHKEIRLVFGGKERQDSVYSGLREIEDENSIVAIHDGVRPFISCQDISASIDAAEKFGAGILGIPAQDTIKSVNGDLLITDTVERNSIWLAQTPQTFQFRLIMDAHMAARKSGFKGTDDASLVEAKGKPVKMVAGHKYNIKITTPEDLKLAEAVLSMNAK